MIDIAAEPLSHGFHLSSTQERRWRQRGAAHPLCVSDSCFEFLFILLYNAYWWLSFGPRATLYAYNMMKVPADFQTDWLTDNSSTPFRAHL